MLLRLAPPLLLVACSPAPDMAACRLVGTWRPTLSSAQEVEVADLAANACFAPVFDAPEAVRGFVESATVTFHPNGNWSAPLLESARPEDVWRWKLVEDRDGHVSAWIGDSPYGSARDVTFHFVSQNTIEVSDFYGICKRYTRVPSLK